VKASDGSWIEAHEKIDGGPSVVFDAIAVLTSEAGAKLLAQESTALDFVNDAFAHLKFIGYTRGALPLLQRAGVADHLDAGFIALDEHPHAQSFIEICGKLRFWARKKDVKQV
jgi:catalase